MTILSAQSILNRVSVPRLKHHYWQQLQIKPFEPQAKQALGMSYGLTSAGYDIRIGQVCASTHIQTWRLEPGDFCLMSSLEWFSIPEDLQVIVHDKSSWARQGLALQNTVLEPGWCGHITLELSNHGQNVITINKGQPIAQLVFHQLDQRTDRPYSGKYQNQPDEPTQAIHED